MSTPNRPRPDVPPVLGAWEAVAGVALASVLAGAAVVLAAARLAAWLSGTGPLRAGLAEAAVAAARLPATPADPAAAWGEHAGALPGPVPYYGCLAATVAAAAAAAAGVVALWRRAAAGRHPLGVDPHAGLATGRRLRSLVVRRPSPRRLTLGRVDGRLVAAEPQASVAVVGPSGCGKSVGFAVPALLEWDGPVIATSVKTDLLAATVEHRCRLGDVWIYDPAGADPHHPSAQWSPVAGCTTWAGAMRAAAWLCDAAKARLDSVSDGDYWYTAARKALAPHLYAAALGGHAMRDVVRWIDTQAREPIRSLLRRCGGVDDEVDRRLADVDAAEERRRLVPGTRAEVLDAVRQVLRADPSRRGDLADERVSTWPLAMQRQLDERVAAEVEAKVRRAIESSVVEEAQSAGDLDALVAAESLWAHEERLRGSVYGTVQNVLLTWSDPMVAAVGRRCDIDLDAWLSGPNTIYVVATPDEQERLRPVFTVLVQQVVRRAYEVANLHGGTLPIPALVLLDEAGNIAPLKDLPAYASTARSHGISLVTVWQDLAQIRALYGHRAPTVLNNHRAKIFGTGISDADTLEYVSRLVGDAGFVERNFSSDLTGGGRRSVSEHTAYRRAAPAHALRRVGPDRAVLVYGSELPALLRLRPWFADRALRRLAGKAPDELSP
ncbi:MAG TPA: type IV secretory system conjugative DNA transfer family protein [Acidimicrobiales bacterium]|nr:type IV secretory system conjugative DNA transfer family protein [Acidimicrobiales bacterium]